MNETKIKVGLIYGGQSFEHEVSKMTAKSILENIDREKFDVSEIYIDENGNFDDRLLKDIDVAFLAVHGPNCEDGKLQKKLEDLGIKYTGAGVEASELNMDKIRQHQFFQSIGLKPTNYIAIEKDFDLKKVMDQIKNQFEYPVFIKPNNGGSSVGASKVEKEEETAKAFAEAFKFDDRAIIEASVKNPREYEVSVLGNEDLVISEPGQILANGQFYSYDKKYFNPFETTIKPASISDDERKKIKEMASKAYKKTGCKGYARVDFFIAKDGEILINEINTLPGFTKISMFPQMMAAIGINYKDLITKIIMLGLER